MLYAYLAQKPGGIRLRLESSQWLLPRFALLHAGFCCSMTAVIIRLSVHNYKTLKRRNKWTERMRSSIAPFRSRPSDGGDRFPHSAARGGNVLTLANPPEWLVEGVIGLRPSVPF